MLFLQNVLSFVIIYLSLRESESSFGKVFTFEKAHPDLPPRGRGTARRRWKEFPRIARPYHPSRALSKPFIQPRVQGRNPARFNGGYWVPRGFKGGSKPSAPCGRLSEAEHPKRKGATLLRPLSAVNRNRPGNSHSRASAPCDFRFPPCFFPHSGRMASIP